MTPATQDSQVRNRPFSLLPRIKEFVSKVLTHSVKTVWKFQSVLKDASATCRYPYLSRKTTASLLGFPQQLVLARDFYRVFETTL